MAIQEFGQSLLSDARERNERERRRERKREEKDLLLGIGMKVADSALTSYQNRKTNEFLRDEALLARNLNYKMRVKRSSEDVMDIDGNAQDPDYLYNKFLPETLADAQAGTGQLASSRLVISLAEIEARRRSEERLKELTEDRVKAARSLVSSSDGSETAYRDAVIASRPSGGIKGAVNFFGNLLTGGTAHDVALTTDMYRKSEEYQSEFRQNPTEALTSTQRRERVKQNGHLLAKGKVVYDDTPVSITATDPNDPTKTKTVSAFVGKINGVNVGYRTVDGEVVNLLSPEQTKRRNTISNIVTSEQANQIRATALSILSEQQNKELKDVFVSLYGTEQDDSSDKVAIRRQFYGNLGQNAGMLLRDFQIPNAVSYSLAAEMEILRHQMLAGGKEAARYSFGSLPAKNTVVGLELETNAESISPILALAALDSLEEKNTLGRSKEAYESFRTSLENNFAGESENTKKFISTFMFLDAPTQSDLLKWMEGYKTFNQPRNYLEGNLSIIDTLIQSSNGLSRSPTRQDNRYKR